MSHRSAMIAALLAAYAVEVPRVTPEAAEQLNLTIPRQPKPRPAQGAKERARRLRQLARNATRET